MHHTPDGILVIETRRVRRTCFRCRRPYICHVDIGRDVAKRGALCGDCVTRDRLDQLADAAALYEVMRRYVRPWRLWPVRAHVVMAHRIVRSV